MIGTTVGPYRVVRKLGEGGMGAVYEALHEAIERRVAIKVLHAQYARNTEFANRFFNEARAVNRVDHPGLVQISDYGQLPDSTAYIVMEYLKGETLGKRLQDLAGPMSVPDVLKLGLQIADSLSAAHAKGIVHRDRFTPSTGGALSFQKWSTATDPRWKNSAGVAHLPSVTTPDISPILLYHDRARQAALVASAGGRSVVAVGLSEVLEGLAQADGQE